MTSPASQPPASWQMYRRMAGRSVALSTACTPASMGCTMKGMAAAWGGVDRAGHEQEGGRVEGLNPCERPAKRPWTAGDRDAANSKKDACARQAATTASSRACRQLPRRSLHGAQGAAQPPSQQAGGCDSPSRPSAVGTLLLKVVRKASLLRPSAAAAAYRPASTCW